MLRRHFQPLFALYCFNTVTHLKFSNHLIAGILRVQLSGILTSHIFHVCACYVKMKTVVWGVHSIFPYLEMLLLTMQRLSRPALCVVTQKREQVISVQSNWASKITIKAYNAPKLLRNIKLGNKILKLVRSVRVMLACIFTESHTNKINIKTHK